MTESTDKDDKARFNERRYSDEASYSSSDYRLKNILRLIGTGHKVLDVGCYSGALGRLIADNGNDVYGVDLSETSVNLAIKKGIKAFKIDAENSLPFSTDLFDVVFVGEMIEHVYDTDRFLQEVKRVLRPDGYLILTTPNLASLGRRLLLILGKNPLVETSLKGNSAGHIRYFVNDSLFGLLKENNFATIDHMSDIINFDNKGKYGSVLLAKVFPTLGRTIIVKAKNVKAPEVRKPFSQPPIENSN